VEPENIFVVRRSPDDVYDEASDGYSWLDRLGSWFDDLTLSVERDVLVEARRLLDERRYRPAL